MGRLCAGPLQYRIRGRALSTPFPWCGCRGGAVPYAAESLNHSTMKPLAPILAALAVAVAPAPAQANAYQQAQAGALAYCSARAAGKSHEQANRAFSNATVDVAGFSSLFNSRAVNEQGSFLVRQMCPQFF